MVKFYHVFFAFLLMTNNVYALNLLTNDNFIETKKMNESSYLNSNRVWDINKFIKDTKLIDVRYGSTLNIDLTKIQDNKYETAYGVPVNIAKMYSPNWVDVRFLFLTPIDNTNGLLWGVNTGEYSNKYEINKGLVLGYIHVKELSKNLKLTIQGTKVIVGGDLNEKTCLADYGQVAGEQEVNCRLAFSAIPPEETLKELIHEKAKDDNRLVVKLKYLFF